MCVTFLGKFYQSLKDESVKFNSADIEKAIIKSCKDAKGKENRFVSKLQISHVFLDSGCVESDSSRLHVGLDVLG